ncbi:MAG: hypothetical protein IT364_05615, partial [Candidatus Hydrogenedentes bacterium]|nr:hypothetical protein [Candidatus Hydrogenedentota bacterium]
MASISAEIGPGERIDIGKGQWIVHRDGIVFYRVVDALGRTETAAVPEDRIRIVHRAKPVSAATPPPRVTRYAMYGLVFVFPWLFAVEEHLLGYEPAIVLRGLTLVGFFLATLLLVTLLSRRKRRAGWCTTALSVKTLDRTLTFGFDHIPGEDPALEALLDGCKDRRTSSAPGRLAQVSLVFRIPLQASAGLAFYGLLTLLAMAIDQANSGYELLTPDTVLHLVAAAAFMTPLLLNLVFDASSPRALRAARSALLADELEAARLMLVHFLAEKPRHVYGNLLMAACALMEGDIQLAAKHRQVMCGENGRFRLAEDLFSLAYRVSSAGAFQAVAEYAAKGAFNTASQQTDSETTHEQPAH